MPEGDSIHSLALRLQPLVGQTLGPSHARRADLTGRTIRAIRARGKHLLIEFTDDWTLRVHLGIGGRWRTGARDPAPVTLRADQTHTVENALHATLVRDRDVPALLAHLGPDLLGPEPDWQAVTARALADPTRQTAQVLLDQRVAAGLGNVYKSELCFLHKTDPWSPIAQAPVEKLYRDGRRLLQANVGPGPRTTSTQPGLQLWVYDRRGRPCPRCRRPIQRAMQGTEPPRQTFWCVRCQGPGPLT